MEVYLNIISVLFLVSAVFESNGYKERTYTIGFLTTLGIAVAMYLVK